MKALSLWQPWASLVACGAKTIETRHWPAPAMMIGERIAIHAAKRTTHLELATLDPRAARALAGALPLPLGCIICTVVIESTREITIEHRMILAQYRPDELAFGDFTRGRYAWQLAHLELVAPPIPTVGRQRFFDVPDPVPA